MPESYDTDKGPRAGLAFKIFFGVGISVFLGTCAAIVSPPGRELLRSVRDFYESIEKGATAMGMVELRAIGCDTAISVPVEEMAELTSSLSDKFDTESSMEGVPPGTRWIQCRVDLPALDVPTCEKIARTYGAATSINDPFIVVSGKPGTTVCSGYYMSDGSRLGAIGETTLGLKPE